MPTTSEEKYKNRYRIPSARASWHDYLDGAYFVTICTKNRELYLGNIADGELTLSEIGRYAEEQFREVSSLYPYAEIPSFIVMPNHIHAIVIIDNRRDAINCVSDDMVVSEMDSNVSEIQENRGGITGRNNPMLYRSLGTVIRGLKGKIAHYANEKDIGFAWQSRFHDRIIRDQKDMIDTAIYIDGNVVNWDEDELHR